VSTATDKFWNETYIQEEGIMAFYHKLTRHAARMVRPPDRYTFKSHLVARMPGNMFNYLLSKEVTAEYSTVEMILHYARRVEENTRQRARWTEERQTIGEARMDTNREQKTFRKQEEMYGNNQRYEAKQVTLATNTTGQRVRCKEAEKETTNNRTKDPERRVGYNKREDKIDEDVCFGCGQKGHKKRDPKCPKNNQTKKVEAQLYAAREIIEEEEWDNQNDSEEEPPVENEDPYYGSQYTSEGEEVEIDDFECQEWSDQERLVEQMCMIRTQESLGKKSIDKETSRRKDKGEDSSGDELGLPLLVEIDDEGTEEETDFVTIRREAFRAMNADQGSIMNEKTTKNDGNTPLKMRKSSKILERPIHLRKETQTFVIMVKVNGQKAVALLDSGCTTNAVTLELTRIVGLKIYKLKEQVPLQLGTRGSQAKINYGMKACIKYGPIETCQYLDIVNIDRYDVTLGTVFMRKHGIVLDFKRNQVRIGDKELPTIRKDADEFLQI
jgi:hypothetical protein